MLSEELSNKGVDITYLLIQTYSAAIRSQILGEILLGDMCTQQTKEDGKDKDERYGKYLNYIDEEVERRVVSMIKNSDQFGRE